MKRYQGRPCSGPVSLPQRSRMRADAHVRAVVVPPLNLSSHGIDPPPVNYR